MASKCIITEQNDNLNLTKIKILCSKYYSQESEKPSFNSDEIFPEHNSPNAISDYEKYMKRCSLSLAIRQMQIKLQKDITAHVLEQPKLKGLF